MKDVLKHPHGPMPWVLKKCDGTPKKTNNSSLARHLGMKTIAADVIPQPYMCNNNNNSLFFNRVT